MARAFISFHVSLRRKPKSENETPRDSRSYWKWGAEIVGPEVSAGSGRRRERERDGHRAATRWPPPYSPLSGTTGSNVAPEILGVSAFKCQCSTSRPLSEQREQAQITPSSPLLKPWGAFCIEPCASARARVCAVAAAPPVQRPRPARLSIPSCTSGTWPAARQMSGKEGQVHVPCRGRLLFMRTCVRVYVTRYCLAVTGRRPHGGSSKTECSTATSSATSIRRTERGNLNEHHEHSHTGPHGSIAHRSQKAGTAQMPVDSERVNGVW